MFGNFDYKFYVILGLVLLQSCNSGGGGYKNSASYSVGPNANFYAKSDIKSSKEKEMQKNYQL